MIPPLIRYYLIHLPIFRDETVHFGLKPPDIVELEAMARAFDDEEKVWLMFEEFENDINKVADEEWVVVRLVRISIISLCMILRNTNLMMLYELH